MAVTTVRDIIRGSMRLIGAIAIGENPSAEEASEGLSVLNEMLDSWSQERLIIPFISREAFPLIPGQQSYTMGPTGDFNTAQPLDIKDILVQVAGTNPVLETPVEILTHEQWVAISVKSTPSSLVTKAYIQGTSPLETIQFWPVPTVANNIVIYSTKPLASYSTINDSFIVPQGYTKAIRYNLAIALSPEYGKPVSVDLISGAMQSKENIKRMNIKPELVSCDAGVLSARNSFNWLTGE